MNHLKVTLFAMSKIIAATLTVPILYSAAYAESTTPDVQVNKTNQVVGTSETLSAKQLRSKIVATEKQFFDLYNKLNDIPDYDIKCETEVPSGSHVSVRTCKPRFAAKAHADEGQMWFGEGLGNPGGGNKPSSGYTGAPAAQNVIDTKSDDFKKHTLELMNKNPELRKLADEREELERRYAELQKQKP